MFRKEPLKVLITGAAGQIGYQLVDPISTGRVFGKDQPIDLVLLDIPMAEESLKGTAMEIEDCAYPLLHSFKITVNQEEGFKDVDWVIFVGAFPRKDGMERKDLLLKNGGIFKAQGQLLNKLAKKTVKCVVVGNPANTNCLILKKFAPDIPRENFTALTRLDHNRILGQIAKRAHVPVFDIHGVMMWGNHSNTQYPCVDFGWVMKDGKQISIREAVKDDTYLNGDFIKCVQTRGAEVIKQRKGLSSAVSAAKAICDHVRDWFFGTVGDSYVSMAIPSSGQYGIKEEVIFSYPVRVKGGKITVVEGLQLNEFSQKMLEKTYKELVDEKELAFKSMNI